MLTNPGTPVSSAPGPSSTSTTTATPAGAQHRLMLKQTPIDVWSLREQLGLASAVLKAGDQNWVSVSRQMKPFSEEGRPHDWFSQKNCALQYNLLLEKVDTPRRKRGDKNETVETPGEAIVRRLKAERLLELKRVIEQQASQMKRLEEEVQLLNDPSTPDEVIDEIEQREEDDVREENERLKTHAAWLAEREEKKMAIQAALKAHSAKLPLKGAAAAAVTAANNARRSSALSEERHSFSDVDSPLNHVPVDAAGSANPSTSTNAANKAEGTEPTSSSSPLLTSLLKSPTTNVSNVDKKSADESMEVDEHQEAVLMEAVSNDFVDNDVSTVENSKPEADIAAHEVNHVETVSVTTVDEVKAETIDEKKILDEADEVTEDEVVEVIGNDSTIEEMKNGNDLDQDKAHAPLVEDDDNEEPTKTLEEVKEPNVNDLSPELVTVKIENMDNGDPALASIEPLDVEIKMEDQKQTGNDINRRPARTQPSMKSASRRQRNQSDLVGLDEESVSLDEAPLRRETRSKKTSERSDEVAGLAGDGAEESPLPPPAMTGQAAARETRRSAAKKSLPPPSLTTAEVEDMDLSKEDEMTPNAISGQSTPFAENRRISRLRDKEASANRKTSRRGSGTLTASRSSSPVPSGDDESEVDSNNLPRSTRTRQKSGKALTTPTPPTTDTPVDDFSVPASPAIVEISTEASGEDDWVRSALSILTELTQHVVFEKLVSSSVLEAASRTVQRPVSVESLRRGLEGGAFKSVHEFHAEIMLLLVSIVMSVSWETELLISAQSLFNEFSETIRENLHPISNKSIPPTPVKSKSTVDIASNDGSAVKKASKRDASGDADLGVSGVKRKRGSLTTPMTNNISSNNSNNVSGNNKDIVDESSSAPGTPVSKKRRRN